MRKNKRPNLPFLEFKTAKGKQYIYFRRGNQRKRLPDNPDSEEFSQAYWKARTGSGTPPPKHTWNQLIDEYYASTKFTKLAKGSKENYTRHCEDIREKNGKLSVKNFKRSDAIAVQEAHQHTWSKANERLAVLSILCRHAKDLGWIAHNPVNEIPQLKGEEYEAWPNDKLKAFEVYARKNDAKTALIAYELALGTGQRLGDCIKMKWSDFDGEYINVIQQKTNTKIDIYCPNRLQAFLKSLPKVGIHIMAKNPKQPIGKRQVQKEIEKVRRAIGVMEGKNRLVPHGWRYTAAQELANAGVSVKDIQAVTGHKTLAMLEKYIRGAEQKTASKRAQQARERNKIKT